MAYSHVEYDQKQLTLHDCSATKAEFCNGILSFCFDEGFWIAAFHPENSTGKTVRTDAAQVKYYLGRGTAEDCSVYVFRRFFKTTIRKSISIEELIQKIESRKCFIEFLYQYADENSRIIKCALHYPKRPYHEDCQLELFVEKEEYLWNSLREDYNW